MTFRAITTRLLPFAAAFALAAAPLAHAATGTATVFFVHGIPGEAIGLPAQPTLPVDILLNGTKCLLKGVTFGTIAGPLKLPAGNYIVSISFANAAAPCSNRSVVTATASLDAGSSTAIVAALSAKDKPAIDLFPTDMSDIQSGVVRILNANATDGFVRIGLIDSSQNGYTLGLARAQEDNTKEFGPSYSYTAGASINGDSTPNVTFKLGKTGQALLFAVGSAKSKTLTLLVKTLAK